MILLFTKLIHKLPTQRSLSTGGCNCTKDEVGMQGKILQRIRKLRLAQRSDVNINRGENYEARFWRGVRRETSCYRF
jgi:hypothetical protein